MATLSVVSVRDAQHLLVHSCSCKGTSGNLGPRACVSCIRRSEKMIGVGEAGGRATTFHNKLFL